MKQQHTSNSEEKNVMHLQKSFERWRELGIWENFPSLNNIYTQNFFFEIANCTVT